MSTSNERAGEPSPRELTRRSRRGFHRDDHNAYCAALGISVPKVAEARSSPDASPARRVWPRFEGGLVLT